MSSGSKGASHIRIPATSPSLTGQSQLTQQTQTQQVTPTAEWSTLSSKVVSNSEFCNLFNQDPREGTCYTLSQSFYHPLLPCIYRFLALQVTTCAHLNPTISTKACSSCPSISHKLDQEAVPSSFTLPGVTAM